MKRSKEYIKSRISQLLDKTEHFIRQKYLGSDGLSNAKLERGYQHALLNGTEVHIARFQNVIHAFVIL